MTSPAFVDLVADYLALRRGLGFQLTKPGVVLADFARYADRGGHHGPLTIDLAMRWALSASAGDPAGAAWRLTAVRGFARHRAAFDPATEVPPVGLLGGSPRRRTQPHIYSDTEIAALLEEAGHLLPPGGLRARTYVAYFSLLAATGLRLAEGCRLERRDVDLVNGILTVRETKFRKSRLVPLHPTTTQALARYAADRDAYKTTSTSRSFFRTQRAPALTPAAVDCTFRQLRQRLGWTAQGRARRPSIHDVRHTFAVRRLLRFCEDGVDVDRKILALATYLGHANVAHTYWYLTAVPELMAITAERFERFACQPQDGES